MTDALRVNRVREKVNVHPETVTETSVRLLDHPDQDPFRVQRRGRGPAKPTFDASVESKRFHPTVWKAALGWVGGDPQRLVAYSLTDIRTLNKPRPRGTSIFDTSYAAPRAS